MALKHDITDTDMLLTKAARSSVVMDGSTLSTQKAALHVDAFDYGTDQYFAAAAVIAAECRPFPAVVEVSSSQDDGA